MRQFKRVNVVAAAVVGIATAAAAKVGFVLLVVIVTFLVSLGGLGTGGTGGLIWCVRVLSNPIGWLHYFTVGAFTGWMCYVFSGSKIPRLLSLITITGVSLLWICEILWYRGGNYQFNINIISLFKLFNNMLKLEYWVNTLPWHIAWFIPHIFFFIRLPLWLQRFHSSVVYKLQEILGS